MILNHAFKTGEVNDIEKGKRDERVLKATMKKLYEIMIQVDCFSTPLKTQLVRDLG
jgi:hypothetical protein